MYDNLMDRIYEAAFLPEKWLDVLEELGRVANASSGGLLVIKPVEMSADGTPAFRPVDISFVATDALTEALHRCADDHPLQRVLRLERWFARGLAGHRGFVQASDVLSHEELSHDPAQFSLSSAGLKAETGLTTPMANGDAATITLERRAWEDGFDDRTTAALDAYGPHLARASLISARLGLEQAAAAVQALQAIGLPAAILRRSGTVLSTNTLFDQMPELFIPTAFGRLGLADSAADALFSEAVASVRDRRADGLRSIPIAAREGRPATVIHLLPLVRSAFEIFLGADILVVATAITPSSFVPSPSILIGLLDFTPSEARLASALASGQSLAEAAGASAITVKSARTYLERIFAKTGTHRQSELVALLRGIPLLGATQR